MSGNYDVKGRIVALLVIYGIATCMLLSLRMPKRIDVGMAGIFLCHPNIERPCVCNV